MGDHAAAIADFERALEIDPNLTGTYCNRGNAKNNMGDYAAAIADFDRALEVDSKDAFAHNNRGIAKQNMGDYAAAVADFDRALEIDPNLTAAYSNRGAVKTSMGDYAAALADIKRALEIDPKNAEAYCNRGAVKNSMGDDAGAIADFYRALEIDSKGSIAFENLKIMLARKKDNSASGSASVKNQPPTGGSGSAFGGQRKPHTPKEGDDLTSESKNKEERIALFMTLLAVSHVLLFGYILCKGYRLMLEYPPMGNESFNSYLSCSLCGDSGYHAVSAGLVYPHVG